MISKQLGITKEQVAERRKQQELQKGRRGQREKLMDVANIVGVLKNNYK